MRLFCSVVVVVVVDVVFVVVVVPNVDVDVGGWVGGYAKSFSCQTQLSGTLHMVIFAENIKDLALVL